MNEAPQDRNTFYLHWLSLLLGAVLGIFAVLFIWLTQTRDKRDKIYSSLLGMALGMIINYFVLKELKLFGVH